MAICEQCGADAVDVHGICGNCGWQAPERERMDEDADSLGETRAADVLPTQAARGGTSAARLERTNQMPYYAPSSQPTGRSMGTQTSTSRYCGTCGARIAPNEAFCGQCGTPVGSGTGDFGTALNMSAGAPSRYHVGANAEWSSAEGDAPTEAFVVSPHGGYGRTPSMPYGQSGYGPNSGMPQVGDASGSSRTLRIVIGILCLAGSLVSAVVAVIIAIH